jgi:hypothetical protein
MLLFSWLGDWEKTVLDAIQKVLPWLATLATGPKIFLSLAIVCIAGFSLALIWAAPQGATVQPIPTKADTGRPLWPDEKSLDGLKRKLDRISEDNAKIIKLVADSGKYGIYVGDLATQTKKPRDEVVYRLKELQKDGLISILELTDMNVRLNEDIVQLLSPNATQFLDAYLK